MKDLEIVDKPKDDMSWLYSGIAHYCNVVGTNHRNAIRDVLTELMLY